MDKNERRNVLSDTLNRIIVLTQGCDTKASIALGVIGILIGAILSTDSLKSLRQLLDGSKSNPNFPSTVLIVLISITAASVVAGVICMGGVVFPRLSSEAVKEKNAKGKKIEKKRRDTRKIQNLSLIYFGDISSMNKEEYFKRMTAADDNRWINEYSDEIRICSEICNKKYKWFRTGMIFLCGGVCSFIGCIALLLCC